VNAVILDSSLALEWFAHDAIPEALERRSLLDDHAVLVPHLWRFEVTSVLTRWRRQGKVSAATSAHVLGEILSLPVATVEEGSLEAVMSLAVAYELSAYDATYLHVAMLTGEPLATLDTSLVRAAKVVGVVCV